MARHLYTGQREARATATLRRKGSHAVAGHCHYATAIHGHTGGVYGSKRKSGGSSCPYSTSSDSASDGIPATGRPAD